MLSRKQLVKKSICLSLLVLIFICCNPTSVEQPEDHSSVVSNTIKEAFFGNAEKKAAKYIGFTAVPVYKSTENGITVSDSILYTGDTLILELLSSDSIHVKFREYVSSRNSPHTGHQCTYSLLLKNDSLIPDSSFDSSILTFSRIFTQSISPETNQPLITMESIFLPPDPLHFAQVQSIQIGNEYYPMLNGFFNLRGLNVDGPGMYVLYLPTDGIIRLFTYGLMFPSGFGWDLLKY